MPQFPVFLDLAGRLCVVVGGGAVGQRKAQSLRRAGARVRLIDPVVEEGDFAGVERLARPYRAGDLAGAFLVFAATGDRQTNAAIAAEAREAGILVNVADAPEEGDFFLPALLTRGELTFAVSSGGKSPALAAAVRDQLAATFGPEWGIVLEIAAALRQKKLTVPAEAEYNSQILRALLASNLPALLAAGAEEEIDRLLAEVVGADCSLASLEIRLPKGES